MKILLLNPPAKEKHLRANFCSNVSKGNYYYASIDLLVQSGILSKQYEIRVRDSIAIKESEESLFKYVAKEGFDGIVALTGSSSRFSDLDFFKNLKEKFPKLKLLVIGGYLLTQYKEVLAEALWIDGVLLDWSSDESVEFFKGSSGPFSKIALPGKDPIAREKEKDKTVSYPMPRHEMFPLKSYHHPNARYHPYSVIVHSFGCPYKCDYCMYSIVDFKIRPVEDVVEELSHLESIGVREVFFQDPTFAADRKAGIDLCKEIIRKNLKVSWFCQTRIDHMDGELLALMSKAGCHAIMFGVESSREVILKEHGRKALNEKTREVYKICRKFKINTLSYLVIGLPEDSEDSIMQTLKFVKDIGSDYVSFNIAVPVIGTQMREKAVQAGLLDNAVLQFDNSSDKPFMPTKSLSLDELSRIHARAVKSFYLRPFYILKRLVSVRSFYELKTQAGEGLGMFKRLLAKGNR
jgi:anaerobic magnesium-protoporphyrin IX monomethyl ester cyclase